MAANIKPFGDRHAISNVLFIFEFAVPLAPHAFTALRAGGMLHERLKADLPRVTEQQQMLVNFAPDQHFFSPPPFAPQGVIGGISFDRVKPNGEPAVAVNIQSNALFIVCGEYERWNDVWAEVKNYLTILSPFLKGFEVSAMALQYTDAFKVNFPRGENHPLTELFSTKTRYLPSNADSLTDSFHSHHGYFSEPKFSLAGKILTNVNINVTEQTSVFDVQILTMHKYQLFDTFVLASSEGDFNPLTDKVFQYLHDENKVVVGDLLTDQVKETISFNSRQSV